MLGRDEFSVSIVECPVLLDRVYRATTLRSAAMFGP